MDLLKDIDLNERVQIRDECGGLLTGKIVYESDSILQLEEVPGRIINIWCAKILTIRNLTA